MPTEQQTKAFIDALEDAGYEPVAYSGRGMYGKECVSLKGDDLSLWEIARALPEDMNVPEPQPIPWALGSSFTGLGMSGRKRGTDYEGTQD